MMTFFFILFFSNIRRVVVLLVAGSNWTWYVTRSFFSTGKQPKMVAIFYKTIIVLLLQYFNLFITFWYSHLIFNFVIYGSIFGGNFLAWLVRRRRTYINNVGSVRQQSTLSWENYSVCTINNVNNNMKLNAMYWDMSLKVLN